MIGAVNTALTGLSAASRRVAVSADNIANQFSSDYTPKRVQQVSQATGGTRALVTDAPNATAQFPMPDHPLADAQGLVTMPNVDVANELVNQMVASYDYKANLKTIKVAGDMQKNLLDIIS